MRKLLNVGSLDQTKINTLSRWWNCQQKNLFVANKVPTHSGSNNWLTFFDGFYFIFQVSSWMFFKIFTIKLWTSKLITRWLLALKLQNLLKRRAKQQRWRLWYFVIICFPFFSQKQNALVSQRTPQFGPSLLLKRIEKITNKLGKLFSRQSLVCVDLNSNYTIVV